MSKKERDEKEMETLIDGSHILDISILADPFFFSVDVFSQVTTRFFSTFFNSQFILQTVVLGQSKISASRWRWLMAIKEWQPFMRNFATMVADSLGICVQLHSLSGELANRPLKFSKEFICCVKRNCLYSYFVN